MITDKLSHELDRLHASMRSGNRWKPLVKKMMVWAQELEQRTQQPRCLGLDVHGKLVDQVQSFKDDEYQDHSMVLLGEVKSQEDGNGKPMDLTAALVMAKGTKHPFDVLDEREHDNYRAVIQQMIAAVAVPNEPKVRLVEVQQAQERLVAIAREHRIELTVPQRGARSQGEGTHGAGAAKIN